MEAVKANANLRILNLESNFISGNMLKNLVEALNSQQTILEFRAANQRPQILGNRVEMAIAKLIELNTSLLRLGLNLDVPDARMRIAQRLQTNSDNCKCYWHRSEVLLRINLCSFLQCVSSELVTRPKTISETTRSSLASSAPETTFIDPTAICGNQMHFR